MTEDASLLLSRWQREAERAPLDHIQVGGDLAEAGIAINFAGDSILRGFVTDHILRDAKAALSTASRLLREIEEKRT